MNSRSGTTDGPMYQISVLGGTLWQQRKYRGQRGGIDSIVFKFTAAQILQYNSLQDNEIQSYFEMYFHLDTLDSIEESKDVGFVRGQVRGDQVIGGAEGGKERGGRCTTECGQRRSRCRGVRHG